MRSNSIAVAGKIYPRSRDEDNLDLRYSAGGVAFMNFNLSAWSHKNDNDDSEYLSYRAVVFGEQAVNLAESCEPGDQVIAIGRLQANNWTDDEGKKRYDTQLIVDEIGASLRWNPAVPVRVESSGAKAGSRGPQARESYDADEAPF